MNENTYTTQNTFDAQAQNNESLEKKSNVQSKAVAWLGVTGSTLLMLSATIFVWSGWNDFPNAAKFGIIAMIAAMCFGTGQFLSKSLPVMGSIFTHLAIFLTPIVLLSGNMEAILPWRQFMLLEGFFCVAWFYGISRVYKSPVLLPASIASTALIALGLSSLEETVFGSIPAALYMIPVIIGLAVTPKLSKPSIYLLAVVGFSPILTLIQPIINTGKGTIAGFGFVSGTHWGYSLATALGLFLATALAARTQKAMWILSLIPATVVPYLLMSFTSDSIALGDMYLIAPVLLLVAQSVLLFAKNDSFFSSRIESLSKGFNISILIIESYVSVVFAMTFFAFSLSSHSSEVVFLTPDQTLGLLLFLCVGIVAYVTDRNIGHGLNLSILSFFAAFTALELTDFINRSEFETRLTIALMVSIVVCIAFKKHFLGTVLIPLTLTSLYVGASNDSPNAVRIIVGLAFLTSLAYGLVVSDKSDRNLQSISATVSAIWLLVYGFAAIGFLANDFVGDTEVYQVGFIFIVGLACAQFFDLVSKESGNESNVIGLKIRPSAALLAVAYLTTMTCGFFVDPLAGAIFAGVVVVIALVQSVRGKDSLALILAAGTFVAGVYAVGDYFNLDNSTTSLVLIGASGVWILLSTYMKGNELGSWVNAGVSATLGTLFAVDSGESFGQAMFILGLIVVSIGIIRSVVALIPIGATVSTIGLWITLSAQGIESLTLYVAPICIGLIALGMFNRNVFPSKVSSERAIEQTNVSSWIAYSFPLVLFFLATFMDSIILGEDYFTLIGAGTATISIAIGAWRKIIAPLVLGTVFLGVYIVRQIFDVANVIPVWAWIGFGALVLIGVAVLLEKSQLSPAQARRRISAVVADHFE
jgi:hypothetical protein